MNGKTTPDFILIDDDRINNIICTKVIQKVVPDAVVHTFTEPEKGLDYIQSVHWESDSGKTTLFLDINMPVLTGWDVLDRFKNFTERIKEHVTIFMLSSSVNSADIDRANSNPHVSGFISKPLAEAALKKIF
jgi:CheY-like chemotaxis protein